MSLHRFRNAVPASEGAHAHAVAARSLAIAFVIAAAVFLLLACPQTALAKSYSMPRVDIAAEVQPDGALQVQEQRTFDFDGSFTCVWWTFDSLAAGSSLEVTGVSLTDGSGRASELSEVPFQTQWRSSGGPGYASYSVDVAQASVYVFFEADDEQLTVGLSYRMEGAAQAHSDVAELYWQYVGSQWAEASDARRLVAAITLPVPEGTAVQAGENVRAWGHGPLDGDVSVNDDGTVTYVVPSVAPGEFAEARIAFPGRLACRHRRLRRDCRRRASWHPFRGAAMGRPG